MKHIILALLVLCGLSGMVHAIERTVALPYQYNTGTGGAHAPACTDTQYVAASNGSFICKDFTPNQILACQAKGAFYVPSHAQADADGCVVPIVVERMRTVPISGGCTGYGCTVSLDMTPYLSRTDVSIQATCSGQWCWGVSGVARLPSLVTSWSGLTVAINQAGTKHSYIAASYNAANHRLTLQTAYTGAKTSQSLGSLRISNIGVLYTSREIALP